VQLSAPDKSEQQDDGNGHAQQVQQNSTAHKFLPPEFKNGTCTVRMLTRGPADGFRSYSVTGGSLAKAFTALLQEVPD
jgi:hypothetical protein